MVFCLSSNRTKFVENKTNKKTFFVLILHTKNSSWPFHWVENHIFSAKWKIKTTTATTKNRDTHGVDGESVSVVSVLPLWFGERKLLSADEDGCSAARELGFAKSIFVFFFEFLENDRIRSVYNQSIHLQCQTTEITHIQNNNTKSV